MAGSRLMAKRRGLAALLLVAVLLVGVAACGPAEPAAPGGPLPSVDAPPPFASEAVSGRYAVEGVTVQATTGRQREIEGTLDLRVDGVRYGVDFELFTTAPDLEGRVPVRVVGDGSGFVVGETFTGTTEEWMTLLPPDGGLEALDLGADLPARAGRKIVSASRGSFDDDGSFEIVLQNYAAPGERYEASMTVLHGRRLEPGPP